jgi:hypothetical protein
VSSTSSTEPEPGHDEISAGSSEGVVVPTGDYPRLTAIERHVSAEEIEEPRLRPATRRTSVGSLPAAPVPGRTIT